MLVLGFQLEFERIGKSALMREIRLILVLASGLVFGLQSQPLHAALILGFDASTYEVAPGGTVDVDLLLKDEFGGPISPFGLFGGGGRILKTGGIATASIPAIVPGPGFGGGPTTFFPPTPFPVAAPAGDSNLAGLLTTIGFFDLPVGAGASSIILGTFSLTVSGLPGDELLITASELDSSLGFAENVEFFTFALLDPLITTFETATITVIPEPSSIVLLLCGGVPLVWWARRRRNSADGIGVV